jgi:hypothetical protein
MGHVGGSFGAGMSDVTRILSAIEQGDSHASEMLQVALPGCISIIWWAAVFGKRLSRRKSRPGNAVDNKALRFTGPALRFFETSRSLQRAGK